MAEAKFVQGPIMKHVVSTSVMGSIGITALFLVDLLDMFFLSLLGEQHVAAAIGYAGSISFFTTSVGIGLAIAAGAVVSKAMGENDEASVRSLFLNTSIVTVIFSAIISLAVYLWTPTLLTFLGAKDDVFDLAKSYLDILVPSLPIICLAMSTGAVLRAVSDIKLSMNATLVGGAVNAIFDPIFIFALSMEIEGAAIASVLSRMAALAVALYGVLYKHDLKTSFDFDEFKKSLPSIFSIAIPAVITNGVTPIGNVVVIRVLADFSDGYVAGWAIISRVVPVAFGTIFALSSAIGPIVGQNHGAKRYDRIRQALKDGIKFCAYYTLGISILLFFSPKLLIWIFNAKEQSADLITFFCHYVMITYFFLGVLFIANATFNNLGRPSLSTLFNVGRATIGCVPFVYIGALLDGANGVILGQAIGSSLFGIAAIFVAFKLVNLVEAQRLGDIGDEKLVTIATVNTPLSSGNSTMAQLCEEEGDDDNYVKPKPLQPSKS